PPRKPTGRGGAAARRKKTSFPHPRAARRRTATLRRWVAAHYSSATPESDHKSLCVRTFPNFDVFLISLTDSQHEQWAEGQFQGIVHNVIHRNCGFRSACGAEGATASATRICRAARSSGRGDGYEHARAPSRRGLARGVPSARIAPPAN